MNRTTAMSLLGFTITVIALRPGLTTAAAQSTVPDFHGYWTNATFTPLERPPELANKEFFSEAEAAAELKKRLDRYRAQPKNDIHYDDVTWQDETYDMEPNRRTSLIFDPANGRVPPLTAEAATRQAVRAALQEAGSSDGPESRSLAERCISWGNVGPPMMPPTYNANLQILQTGTHVVIFHEMIHDVRVIPVDGRPHLPSSVRRLAGDSVGH